MQVLLSKTLSGWCWCLKRRSLDGQTHGYHTKLVFSGSGGLQSCEKTSCFYWFLQLSYKCWCYKISVILVTNVLSHIFVILNSRWSCCAPCTSSFLLSFQSFLSIPIDLWFHTLAISCSCSSCQVCVPIDHENDSLFFFLYGKYIEKSYERNFLCSIWDFLRIVFTFPWCTVFLKVTVKAKLLYQVSVVYLKVGVLNWKRKWFSILKNYTVFLFI